MDERVSDSAVDFSAVVTDIRMESRVGGVARWQMALDRTEIGVGNVGSLHAVARSGTRIEVPVLAVIVSPASAFAVKSLPGVSSTTLVMPVWLVPIVTVPPPATSSSVVPPLPVIVAPSVAAVTCT